jgi:hypothetical protein
MKWTARGTTLMTTGRTANFFTKTIRKVTKMTDGTDFENEIRHLLSMQGWSITQEKILSHKKIDAYGEKRGDFGQLERYAIEVKDYASPLTQEYVTKIYANYLPLLKNNLVDKIVLVTRNSIAPSAKTYCDTIDNFIHITYLDLLNSLIDFSSYVQGMKAQYFENHLNEYYVKQDYDHLLSTLPPQPSVEEAVLNWISSDDTRPIAILASYGMGKTTLLKRIAYVLANQHFKDPLQRIPILIKLEQISSEQSLEGLIGKHFTSISPVGNYNFHTFLSLNQRGRFVILLDGFDEMKQAISWEGMHYNFEQLNRLYGPNAKLIIAGRPSAFLSEDEYQEVLHGRRVISGKTRYIPNWPNFHELHLTPFTEAQIQFFITSYSKLLYSSSMSEERISNLRYLLSTGRYQNVLDLAKRPVQLEMILLLLPTWEGDLDNLTLTILYSEFVDFIINREVGKTTRQRFLKKDRRNFASELAFWMWSQGVGSAISVSNIPESLISMYCFPGDSLDEVKRDLIGACFLEFKPPEGLYFPHRSFQEFLVANHLIQLISNKSIISLENINITPEVQMFFRGLINESELYRFRNILWLHSGIHADWIIDLFLSCHETPDEIIDNENRPNPNQWSFVCLARGLSQNRWNLSPDKKWNIIKNNLLRVPKNVPYRDKWCKLMSILILYFVSDLRKHKIDPTPIILDWAKQAQINYHDHGRLTGFQVIKSCVDTDFCCLESWNAFVIENKPLVGIYLSRLTNIKQYKEHIPKANKETDKARLQSRKKKKEKHVVKVKKSEH